jgi:membrane protease YdiL (CAAX protease family)
MLVVLPPIAEEILFRGFIYSSLRPKMNKIVAALITSILFALPHLFESSNGLLWVAGCDTFILSMVLVYVREKTDKLWASMLIHGLKNFVAFASLYLIHSS